MMFLKLVSRGEFPLSNVAFRLFLDVVRWHGLQTTTAMTYSHDSKLFWRTGYKLFHGKFLKFIGGFKNEGQVVNDACIPGHFSPQMAKINFAVPDIKSIQDYKEILPTTEIVPGLLRPLFDAYAERGQTTSHKLCVDGKKINPSTENRRGEVNLFGFEDRPTADE